LKQEVAFDCTAMCIIYYNSTCSVIKTCCSHIVKALLSTLSGFRIYFKQQIYKPFTGVLNVT